MLNQIFKLDLNSNLSLQEQIRAGLTQAILKGYYPSDKSLPSSRKLSQSLNVARNTVVLAYEQLVDEGLLVTRARSGFYVNPDFVLPEAIEHSEQTQNLNWTSYFKGPQLASISTNHDDWRSYRYPFVYGKVDPDTFPIEDWRKCSLRILNKRNSINGRRTVPMIRS
ncbi:transcriptional regulator [Vibrio sp. JCM 19236]|nr:transcriptional regulator [Vibrio sp. JCM 19236]